MDRFLETVVGDEVEVKVAFDYTPRQEEARTDPYIPDDVRINGVLVGGKDEQDIIAVLCEDTIDALRVECFDMMGWEG